MTLLSTAAEFVLVQQPPPTSPAPLITAPPIPNPPAHVPEQLQGFGDLIIGLLKWVLMVAGVGGLLACAIMIVVGRRNRNQVAQQGIFDVGYVMIGLAIGSVAAVIVSMFAL